MARRFVPARRTVFDLGDIETWVTNIKNTVSEEAAEMIVTSLKEEGPYWTGQFEEGWRVELGRKEIPATQEPLMTQEERRAYGQGTRRVTPVPGGIPKATGRKSIEYSIDNVTSYRDIAKDLVPGRFEDGKRNTAPKDWYAKYTLGGKLMNDLERATQRAASQKGIRDFKGKL